MPQAMKGVREQPLLNPPVDGKKHSYEVAERDKAAMERSLTWWRDNKFHMCDEHLNQLYHMKLLGIQVKLTDEDERGVHEALQKSMKPESAYKIPFIKHLLKLYERRAEITPEERALIDGDLKRYSGHATIAEEITDHMRALDFDYELTAREKSSLAQSLNVARTYFERDGGHTHAETFLKTIILMKDFGIPYEADKKDRELLEKSMNLFRQTSDYRLSIAYVCKMRMDERPEEKHAEQLPPLKKL